MAYNIDNTTALNDYKDCIFNNLALESSITEKYIDLGSSNTIDPNLGSLFTKTISSGTTQLTLNVSNVSTSPNTITSFLLELNNNSSNLTVSFWSNVKWENSTKPTIITDKNIFGFYTYDGVNWIGIKITQ